MWLGVSGEVVILQVTFSRLVRGFTSGIRTATGVQGIRWKVGEPRVDLPPECAEKEGQPSV